MENIIPAMVIHRLRNEIGDEGIRKIHKYFETIYVKSIRFRIKI